MRSEFKRIIKRHDAIGRRFEIALWAGYLIISVLGLILYFNARTPDMKSICFFAVGVCPCIWGLIISSWALKCARNAVKELEEFRERLNKVDPANFTWTSDE